MLVEDLVACDKSDNTFVCTIFCEGRLKSKFPYLFFLRILWTNQSEIAGRYNFWVSGNTVKIA